MMLKIALTGGIGSGKSIVARVFRLLGAEVFEADKEAKRLMTDDPGLKKGITGILGPEAFHEKTLNTAFIAKQIFYDKQLLEKINSLVHPAVHREFQRWTAEHSHLPYVIEEAAIIYESGSARFFDHVIVVDAPEDLRIKRVMKRDGIHEDDVRARMARQMPAAEKKKRADYIIINDEMHMLLPQIIELHNKFVSLQAEKK